MKLTPSLVSFLIDIHLLAHHPAGSAVRPFASPSSGRPSAASHLPLARPDVTDRERRYVNDVLRSNRLAMGPYLERFEAAMAAACGAKHAVAVSSGTAALHLIVRGLGLGPGDEVITTPYSFVASSNALLFEGVRPRFVDIDPTTLNLDPGRVEAALSEKTRALLAVDVFGLPADWPALSELARAHDLLLIDDACEAIGASVEDRPIGAWGAAAAFGFYPNKQITTGEGGCITTDDGKLASLCRSLRNQGRATDARMEHVRLGYNYRLGEMAAALGLAQLERLDELLERRRRVADAYAEALSSLEDDLVLPPARPKTRRSWFVYVVRLKDHFALHARDELLERLRASGIGCAPYFPAIHLQPYYRERFGFTPGAFPHAEAAASRTLALPFYGALGREDIGAVAASLEQHLPHLPRS